MSNDLDFTIQDNIITIEGEVQVRTFYEYVTLVNIWFRYENDAGRNRIEALEYKHSSEIFKYTTVIELAETRRRQSMRRALGIGLAVGFATGVVSAAIIYSSIRAASQ